ncbi:MAG TPA: PP2C family protein-serine/threonine phosphatase [Anaeromyxobacter sp.]
MDRARQKPPELTGDLQVAFRAYREGLVHSWSQTLSVLGFSLNALFLLLDVVIVPSELLGRFATYRALVTGAMLVQYFILRRTRPGRWSILPGYVASALFAVMISQMTVDLGGFQSHYYAGLNLVIVGVDVLLPWKPIHSLVNGLAVLGTYVFMNATFGGGFEPAAIVSNLYFMGSTVVISVAISHVRHRLIASEFALRAELVQANADLDRSRVELKNARDALWGEMEVAKRIQTSLLPQNRHVGSYDVAARMLPAAEVGGDYYDIIEAGEDRDWIAIGDVSGHGVESGLVMMMTQTSIMSLVHENPRLSPADVFHAVNDVLLENISRLRAARYMTLNVVRLTDHGLTLAGKHQDVLVWRRATRRVETVVNNGCWIGVVDDTRGHVEDQVVPMEEGDVALFFTDGATEAMNAAGEMFGEERLAAALAEVAERPLDEALGVLFAAVAAFRSTQDDDVTMMLVRRAPDAAAVRQDHAAVLAGTTGS